MSKYIELAKKLKALAERGVDGERYNAEAKLKSLLEKHGLTMEDIEEEEVCVNEIKITKEKKKLFHQIGYHVIGKKYKNTDVRRHRNTIYIKCTIAQAIEIEAKLNFYYKLYKEEMEIFHHAFIQKNNLFAHDGKPQEPKPEDREKMQRVLEMASTIKKESYSKLLGTRKKQNQ